MKIIQNILLICLFVFGLASCDKKEEAPKNNSLEPLAYTLYTDNTEMFVEFKPLVVGATSKFAAHFTVLGETSNH